MAFPEDCHSNCVFSPLSFIIVWRSSTVANENVEKYCFYLTPEDVRTFFNNDKSLDNEMSIRDIMTVRRRPCPMIFALYCGEIKSTNLPRKNK